MAMPTTARVPTRGGAARDHAAGFTLLELMVVIGVISVLTGLSVGYLGRVDPEMLARASINGELRRAQLTARAEGVATEVVVTPGKEGEPSTVRSRLLSPAAMFGFEPNAPVLDEVLRPVLGGRDVEHGRFGHARAPLPGERTPLLRWPAPPAVLDLRDGFLCRCDLWLDRRQAATVLRLPPAVDLSLDEELRLRARLRLRSLGDEGLGGAASVTANIALPLGRWCTVEVACDGSEVWLTVDGHEVGRAVAAGTPMQEAEGTFEVSPGEAPLPGLVDEVRWFVFSWAPLQTLPPALLPQRVYRLGFDGRGDPTSEPVVEWVREEKS
jgi:prepilin-type N-terminal cleavage/methylation domain-containing protein